MGYYRGGDCMYGRGDYYRGDYYRGDPGIGSFFKKALGTALGVARFVPGLGTVANVATAVLGAAKKGQGAVVPTPGMALTPSGAGGGTRRTEVSLFPPRYETETSFGATFGGGGGGGGTAMMAAPGTALGPCLITRDGRVIRGRPNKSTYITRGGGTSRWPQDLIIHPRGTECVRPRRMNVANPRALRRSIRRMAGFAKLARKSIRFVSAKPVKGRPVAKRTRR